MANKKKEAVAPRSIQNRKARFDYNILDRYTAGIALVGSEVKSLYQGKAHLNDAYCRVVDGELYLMNMDVEPYEKATVFQHDRRRDRKLLLHRREIDTIARRAQEKGLTIVPLAVFFNERGKVKAEIALAQGKAAYDKRHKIAEQDTRREIERARAERF